VRKDRFYSSGGTRMLRFVGSVGDIAQLKASGKALTVSIGPGLPKNASECLCASWFIHTGRLARCGYIAYCLFVFVFVRLRISPLTIKLAASHFARQFIGIQGRE